MRVAHVRVSSIMRSHRLIYKSGFIFLVLGLLMLVACTEPLPDVMEPSTAVLSPSAKEVHQRALVLDAHADIEIPICWRGWPFTSCTR